MRFLVVLFFCSSALAADWFVAPNGNDAWSGRLPEPNAAGADGPWATLGKARDAIRGVAGERTVQIRGGLYELPRGLKFTAEDSGRADARVTWQAYQKEKPVLIGGRAISGWKPWKGEILHAEAGAQGFKGINFRQLLFAGERQHLARYPDFDPQNPYGGGWAYADGEMWPMYVDKEGENKHTLQVKPGDWRTWARPQEVEVFIFPRYNWWNDMLPVKAMDAEKHLITTAKDGSYAMRANDRFYFRGALEELDAPGEWYLDRLSGTVYFWPPRPIDSAVYAPTVRDIVTLEGTEYLTLRGLTFECAEGSAVVVKGGSHNRLVACTVRNVGGGQGTAIGVSGGADNGIVGCDISFTGAAGVTLDGGDQMTLTAAQHFIENCYLHHIGVFSKHGAGVQLNGVGQRISHCLIHDTPRFAIQFIGNNHVIEYNHLRHIALETEDVGATYSGGRDWLTPRGSVVRYNFIHDVLGYGWNGEWTSPYFAWGIYLDDNSGGADVIGNIVARCGRSLIHGHNARDARVENNIFIEGGLRQWEFNGWTTQHRFWTNSFPLMMKGYESVAGQPAWKNMRGMDVPPDKVADVESRVMSGNVFTRNIMAWKKEDAKALNVVAFNPERNHFDRNLYWHHGKPLLTGIRKASEPRGENLAPNPGFATGDLGKMPADWNFQVRVRNGKAVLVDDGGQRALRIDAALDESATRPKFPVLIAREIDLKPGGHYVLRGRFRTDRAEPGRIALEVQSFHPPKDGAPSRFWLSSPSAVKVEREWKEVELAFSIPKQGEKGWHAEMGKFRVRIDWPEKQGALYAADIRLHETELKDEWKSWQELGDANSVVADPKFLAPEKDDYRLAPDSPAWALGFQPLPVEKIGPYQSADRATWPIVEAEGAREKPLSPKK